MRVDQARRDEGAPQVYLFFGCVARAYSGDVPTVESYIGVFDIAGQNIYQASVAQHQVGGPVAAETASNSKLCKDHSFR